jgi:hypothetical protein
MKQAGLIFRKWQDILPKKRMEYQSLREKYRGEWDYNGTR